MDEVSELVPVGLLELVVHQHHAPKVPEEAAERLDSRKRRGARGRGLDGVVSVQHNVKLERLLRVGERERLEPKIGGGLLVKFE